MECYNDDPTQPLLGQRVSSRQTASKLCGLQSWRRRVPITIWLPKYSFDYLIKDLIAGVTVGLTSIPQGIAYSMIAGVPPQVGLYASIFPGMVYAVFGSCKDVCVGPTAILSALLAKYVILSVDFAFLACFLTGSVILLLGVLQLGFLLDFISTQVISGFTTAAALQIAAAQLKSLFRISGSSGETFISAVINFFKNMKTIQLWDTVLGIVTIVALYLVQFSQARTSEGSSVRGGWTYVVRGRNALVVFAGSALAFVLYLNGITPFHLTGKIEGGLPTFGPPPFSTVVNNVTLGFDGMLERFGPRGLVMPLVAILESIAIAKAFAGGRPVDGTQEMVAVGACNLLASFAAAMPSAGSFTRTALNHASGAATPASSFFKACVVLLAVTLLSETFYFIPRATLAGVIMVAMVSIVELSVAKKLWLNSKAEFGVWCVTVAAGAALGLELGVAAGAGADAARALLAAARPRLHCRRFKVGEQECVAVALAGSLAYAGAAHVAGELRAVGAAWGAAVGAVRGPVGAARGPVGAARGPGSQGGVLVFVLDARLLTSCDFGVAQSLTAVILDLEKSRHRVLLWNFEAQSLKLFLDLAPGLSGRSVQGPSVEPFVIDLMSERQESNLSIENHIN